jgi:hypothetical protein
MDGTISTRAGERQRAPDGLRPFSKGAPGADTVTPSAQQTLSKAAGEGCGPSADLDAESARLNAQREMAALREAKAGRANPFNRPTKAGARQPEVMLTRPAEIVKSAVPSAPPPTSDRSAVIAEEDERLPDHLLPTEPQSATPKTRLRKMRKRASVPPGPLPSRDTISVAGERFVRQTFDDDAWESDGTLFPALLATPIDERWVRERREELASMSSGVMELIDKRIFNIATALSNRSDWFDLWRDAARCCPREWLVLFVGVAMLMRDGEQRALDNRRARSMLALGVLAWLLCEYDPDGDPTAPWVIRLPRKAWQQMLAYWEPYADGSRRRVPFINTVFGTHEVGGQFIAGQCGYISAWLQAGIAKASQLEGLSAPPGLAGPWRRNKLTKKWERWGFVELRLVFSAPDELTAMKKGPPLEPRPRVRRRQMPEPPDDELIAAVDDFERWCDEQDQQSPGAEADHGAHGDCSELLVRSSDEHGAQTPRGGRDDDGGGVQAAEAQPMTPAPSSTAEPGPPPPWACPPPLAACESQQASHQSSAESLSELLQSDARMRDDPYLARLAARLAARPAKSERPGFVEVYEKCRADLDALDATRRKPPG